MKRWVAALAVAAGAFLLMAPAGFAHEFNPPNGGIGDTPLNSLQARANAFDNYLAALSHSEGANSLFRNPTCGAHGGPSGIHPPGNP